MTKAVLFMLRIWVMKSSDPVMHAIKGKVISRKWQKEMYCYLRVTAKSFQSW